MSEDGQPQCDICGRFGKARRNPEGVVIGWYLPCVMWDGYMGGYEHE